MSLNTLNVPQIRAPPPATFNPLLTNFTPYIHKKNLLMFCLVQIRVEYLGLMSHNVTICMVGYKLELTQALQKPKH